MTPLWSHQERGVAAVLAAIAEGIRRILLTSPTGMGKSRLVCEVITALVDAGWYAVVYTNRRMLVEQLTGVLDAHGIDHGVRAAGYDGRDDAHWPVQVSSLPTETSRVLKRKTWDIHGKGRLCLAVVDEAHLNNGPKAREIMRRHVEAGHTVLGVTATPLDLGGSYDVLLTAGTVSEGRGCGALVYADQYDFASPDLKGIKGVVEGEDLSESQNKKAMMRAGLIGRVFDAFDRLNPTGRPSILFAPGVEESKWFAEQFQARGVSAAHIDGEHVWLEGKLYETSQQMREEIINGSRSGAITVLCNRFVLREGIDLPWLAHGIFATVFGSLQSLLQSGGRLLRAYPALDAVTAQDHGGNFFRHGSLNDDRDWFLGETGVMAYGLRADGFRRCKQCKAALKNGPLCGQCGFLNVPQPFRCPACGRLWVRGTVCSPARGGCGHQLDPKKRSREVVMADGTIRRVAGDFFRPRRLCREPDGPQRWERMFFRSLTEKGRRTFRQAFALFASENGWAYPDPSWPLMPASEVDQYGLVGDVPVERLTGDAETLEKVSRWREKREGVNNVQNSENC